MLPYALRWGVANRLDSKSALKRLKSVSANMEEEVLTLAKRSRALGHKNEKTFLYYISQVSPNDIQNIISSKDPN